MQHFKSSICLQKDNVYRFLSESVRSPNVPLLGIPDELANLFDETQRVNVIYEAIQQAYQVIFFKIVFYSWKL